MRSDIKKWINIDIKEKGNLIPIILEKPGDKTTRNGVWMLLGRNNEDEKYRCLQVAKNTDVFTELLNDISYMGPLRDNYQPIRYINYFGMEEYEESIIGFPSVKEQVYSKIENEYADLRAVIVVHGKMDDAGKKQLEKYIAVKTRARFWRNGGSYQKAKKVDFEKMKCDTSSIQDAVYGNIINEIDEYINNNIEINYAK